MADEDDIEVKKYYCGIGPVPKGKERAPPSYCIQTNQVRYYGIEAIDEKLLNKFKGSSNDLQKEKVKLKKIESDAKIAMKENASLKLILNDKKITDKKRKSVDKKMEALKEKGKNLYLFAIPKFLY